jgi:hypothetical protein
MKFSDFENIEQVIAHYPLTITRQQFLPEVEVTPPEWFLQELNFALARQMVGESEMYVREYFVAPFMRQSWMRHPGVQLWVNRKLAYKDELYGEPDYFISVPPTGPATELIGKPLLAVAEAKREDFSRGWGQCLAEMIACQKINDDERVVIYGIVCTGEVWQFGKLEGATFSQNLRAYTIHTPARLLGVLDYLFRECERACPI